MTIGASLAIQKVGPAITTELNGYGDVLTLQPKKKRPVGIDFSSAMAMIAIYQANGSVTVWITILSSWFFHHIHLI